MSSLLIAFAQWATLVLSAPVMITVLRSFSIKDAGQALSPALQTWTDLLKLAYKPSGLRPRSVKIALAVHGGAILAAAAVVPVWSTKTLGSFWGVDDLVLFFGLLTLS